MSSEKPTPENQTLEHFIKSPGFKELDPITQRIVIRTMRKDKLRKLFKFNTLLWHY